LISSRDRRTSLSAFALVGVVSSACGTGDRAATDVIRGADAATSRVDAAGADTAAPRPDAVVSRQDADPTSLPADAGRPAPETDGSAIPPEADAGPAPLPVQPAASDYCELSAAFFCDFYVRCGRMAVDTVAECLEIFGPACNAAYEPQYVAHAEAGLLRLDGPGLAACEAHLAVVDCEAQVFDLDGACAGVWVGLSPAGAPCAPGIGSFVCAAGTACVLDLSFCGTCEPAAQTNAACGPAAGDLRCLPADRCADGLCIARTPPGGACVAREDCVVAADCVDGTCRTFSRAAAGEACDAFRRCPYHSTCVGGTCVVNRRQGEACARGEACDGGRCADGVCVPFGGTDAACADSGECLSGQCESGRCTAPLASCFGG